MVVSPIYNFFLSILEPFFTFNYQVSYACAHSGYGINQITYQMNLISEEDRKKNFEMLINFLNSNMVNFKYRPFSTINLYESNSNTYGIIFQYIHKFFLVFFISFYVYMFMSKNINNFFDNHITKFLIKKLKNQIEQNIGSFEDFYIILIIFFSIFFLNVYFFYNFDIFKMFFYAFSIVLYFVILIPVRIIYFMGACFMVYIKGSSIYKKLFIELMYDITGYMAFFMRFFLQCVRILLLFVFYYLIHEYVFDLGKQFFTNYANKYTIGTHTNLFVTFGLIFRWLFEFFDSLLTIMTQILAYFLISFWLFSFLYTTIFKKKSKFYKWLKK